MKSLKKEHKGMVNFFKYYHPIYIFLICISCKYKCKVFDVTFQYAYFKQVILSVFSNIYAMNGNVSSSPEALRKVVLEEFLNNACLPKACSSMFHHPVE